MVIYVKFLIYKKYQYSSVLSLYYYFFFFVKTWVYVWVFFIHLWHRFIFCFVCNSFFSSLFISFRTRTVNNLHYIFFSLHLHVYYFIFTFTMKFIWIVNAFFSCSFFSCMFVFDGFVCMCVFYIFSFIYLFSLREGCYSFAC